MNLSYWVQFFQLKGYIYRQIMFNPSVYWVYEFTGEQIGSMETQPYSAGMVNLFFSSVFFTSIIFVSRADLIIIYNYSHTVRQSSIMLYKEE